jgi:hypothetical protein
MLSIFYKLQWNQLAFVEALAERKTVNHKCWDFHLSFCVYNFVLIMYIHRLGIQ